MTAPSIRGYWTNDGFVGSWTTAPVAGDTIYVFTGPRDYQAGYSVPPNSTNFPVVRSNGNYSHLAKRTATGTSTDNPTSENSIAIAVYGTDGERYAGNWQATSINSTVGAIGVLNSNNPVGVDDLLVVVATGALLTSYAYGYFGGTPINQTPSGMIQSAQCYLYDDYTGDGQFGNLTQATLLRKQLTSTTNPGSVSAAANVLTAAYNVYAESTMAILIKGSSAPSGPTAYGPSIRR